MKKFIIVIISILSICILLSACKKEKISQVSTDDQNLILTEVSVELVEDNRETIGDNEIVMLTVNENYPLVTIKNNENAAEKINTFYQSARETLKVMEEEYLTYAIEDYSLADEETRKYWNGYGLGKTYEKARADQKVISIVELNYEYAGGAHPNSYSLAQNFDTATGGRLTLEDVLSDTEKGKEFIIEYVVNYIENSEYTDYVFEDYRDNVNQILTEDTWYFSDSGFTIISNEYIIGPHAAGIMEFTIPYEEFLLLKEEYKLK